MWVWSSLIANDPTGHACPRLPLNAWKWPRIATGNCQTLQTCNELQALTNAHLPAPDTPEEQKQTQIHTPLSSPASSNRNASIQIGSLLMGDIPGEDLLTAGVQIRWEASCFMIVGKQSRLDFVFEAGARAICRESALTPRSLSRGPRLADLNVKMRAK